MHAAANSAPIGLFMGPEIHLFMIKFLLELCRWSVPFEPLRRPSTHKFAKESQACTKNCHEMVPNVTCTIRPASFYLFIHVHAS